MDEFLKNVNGIEKYSILFMFFIYLFGFVIVNAFLGKYSVYEVNAISTLNIIAGLLFLVFLLEYYFLVWNNLVICIKKYVLWYCSIEMFFLLTLNTFILNNIFFSVHDNLIEYIFFSGFVFFFILELLKIYNKLILAFELIFKIIVVIIFIFSWKHYLIEFIIFAFYFLLTVYLLFFKIIKYLHNVNFYFTSFSLLFGLILFAVYFGKFIYSNIDKSFGGGKEIPVEIETNNKRFYKGLLILELDDCYLLKQNDLNKTKIIKILKNNINKVVVFK